MKKYEVVADYIREQITSGVYSVGKRIPTEDRLIETLGVSRTPVRKALEYLIEEGLIYRVQGSGSFVKARPLQKPIELYAILHTGDLFIESRIIEGMRRAINDNPLSNIHLILNNPGKDAVAQCRVLNTISTDSKCGVISVPLVDTDRSVNRLLSAAYRRLERQGYSVILLDRKVPGYHGSTITTDNFTGAQKMVEYLLSHGHRNLILYYSHSEISSVQERLRGAEYAMDVNRERGEELTLVNVDDTPVTSDDLVMRLSEGDSAVFCLDSGIAKSVYSAADEAGLQVPKDFSLVSFDDPAFRTDEYGNTTYMDQKLENIGYYAVQLVIDQIQQKTEGNLHMFVEPEIVRRKSVARL